eukprot:1370373-Pyramimonas_sp.AAC.1
MSASASSITCTGPASYCALGTQACANAYVPTVVVCLDPGTLRSMRYEILRKIPVVEASGKVVMRM